MYTSRIQKFSHLSHQVEDYLPLPDTAKIFHRMYYFTATIGYNGQYVNFAVAYGGRREIIHAVKKLCSKVKEGSLLPDEIDEKIFESCLYTSKISNPHPDLIIRTAGEKRLSGFLLWQCAYSELIFLDILWPEFEKKNLIESIETYQNRGRRFGK